MKKKAYFLILGILLCSQAIIVILYYRERKSFDLYKINTTKEINQLKNKKHSIIGSSLNAQFYENTKIYLDSNAFSMNYSLCFYFSQNHCISCIDDCIEQYKLADNIIPESNLIIITSFNQNSIKQIKIKHQLKCKVIWIDETNINIAEKKHPCFFIYNKKRSEMEMILFPIRGEPKILIKYLEYINIKYNINNDL